MSETQDLTPLPIIGNGKQYYMYTCKTCGDPKARNSYLEPIGERMLAARQCWDCDYWADFEIKNEPSKMTIIGGHVYGPGNRTTGEFRGMAGRRFDIEYLPPSIYAGQKCTTFDLWSGSAIPERLRSNFPDTARFLGGAEKANAGGTTCWNPSDHRNEPYPLPGKLLPTPEPTP
jgi:hypothetical protein